MAQTLLDYTVNASSPAPPTGGGAATPGPYSQATVGRSLDAGVTVGVANQPVGTSPLTGVHNTPLHVAVVGIGALAAIVLMHKWGFRLVSVGRYGGR